MNNNISKMFNLQGLLIDRIENFEREIIINCRSPRIFTRCPNCNQSTNKIHQFNFRKVKHGKLDHKHIILNLRIRRFKCKKCGKIFTEKITGIDGRKTTNNFRCQTLDWLQRNSFNYIANKFDISSSTLTRYLLKMANDWQIDWGTEKITKLGIDEHSFRGRNLVISITDLSNHKLLAILKSDNQKTLEAFLKSVPDLAKKHLEEICIDLCSSYQTVIKRCLPKAKIVADRFHVEELAKRTLDDIRQVVQSEEGKRKIHLKKLLLTNKENLTDLELKKLELAFIKYQKFPVLKEAWFIKEKIRKIYWSSNKKEALKKFQEVTMLLETTHYSRYFQTLLKTMRNWQDEILNYFQNKTTNGFTEGCHTKIKMMKRVSFGFRNINNYIAKMMLAFLPLIWIINYHTI